MAPPGQTRALSVNVKQWIAVHRTLPPAPSDPSNYVVERAARRLQSFPSLQARCPIMSTR